MENEILISVIFLGAGLLAYVIIPGLLDVEGHQTRNRRMSRVIRLET